VHGGPGGTYVDFTQFTDCRFKHDGTVRVKTDDGSFVYGRLVEGVPGASDTIEWDDEDVWTFLGAPGASKPAGDPNAGDLAGSKPAGPDPDTSGASAPDTSAAVGSMSEKKPKKAKPLAPKIFQNFKGKKIVMPKKFRGQWRGTWKSSSGTYELQTHFPDCRFKHDDIDKDQFWVRVKDHDGSYVDGKLVDGKGAADDQIVWENGDVWTKEKVARGATFKY